MHYPDKAYWILDKPAEWHSIPFLQEMKQFFITHGHIDGWLSWAAQCSALYLYHHWNEIEIDEELEYHGKQHGYRGLLFDWLQENEFILYNSPLPPSL